MNNEEREIVNEMYTALLGILHEKIWAVELPGVPEGIGWIIPGTSPVMGLVRDAVERANKILF